MQHKQSFAFHILNNDAQKCKMYVVAYTLLFYFLALTKKYFKSGHRSGSWIGLSPPNLFFADNVTLQVIWGLQVMLLQGLDFGWKFPVGKKLQVFFQFQTLNRKRPLPWKNTFYDW